MAIFVLVAELGWEDFTLTLHHASVLLTTMFLLGCVGHAGGICSSPHRITEQRDALGEASSTSTFRIHLYMLRIY